VPKPPLIIPRFQYHLDEVTVRAIFFRHNRAYDVFADYFLLTVPKELLSKFIKKGNLTLNGKVTFRYKDSKRGAYIKTMTVNAEEFIRRFLQHVLPAGVHKVRYYGLWSPSNRKKLLEIQKTLIQSGNDQPEGYEENIDAKVTASSEPRPCPHCKKGILIWIGRLPRQGRAPP
jgi:hypothetical protein